MLVYTKQYIEDLQKIKTTIPNVEKLCNKKIAITGATGLIGSAIVDFLMEMNHSNNAGIEIYAAGRSEERVNNRFQRWVEDAEFHFLQYDAEKTVCLDQEVDFIIHGASNAHPNIFVKEPVDTMLANINGTQNLLECLRCKKAKRLLYISSSEVYGKKDSNTPYKEDEYGYVDLLNPRACYPISKRAAETLCASYINQYNIDAVIVRPGHIYGPTMTDSDSRASSQFPREVKHGQDIVMKSAGTQMRSYCYVLDCVAAIITVLLNGKKGEAYNISNKNSIVNIREMAESFARASKHKVVFEKAKDAEIKGYNLMDNSSLDSEKLEGLGWTGLFDMPAGAWRTLEAMR